MLFMWIIDMAWNIGLQENDHLILSYLYSCDFLSTKLRADVSQMAYINRRRLPAGIKVEGDKTAVSSSKKSRSVDSGI